MSLLSLHPQFFLAVHADRTARYRSEAEAARLGRELARQHRLRPPSAGSWSGSAGASPRSRAEANHTRLGTTPGEWSASMDRTDWFGALVSIGVWRETLREAAAALEAEVRARL